MKIINPSSSWGKRLMVLLENDFPNLTHLGLNLDGMGVDQDWQKHNW